MAAQGDDSCLSLRDCAVVGFVQGCGCRIHQSVLSAGSADRSSLEVQVCPGHLRYPALELNRHCARLTVCSLCCFWSRFKTLCPCGVVSSRPFFKSHFYKEFDGISYITHNILAALLNVLNFQNLQRISHISRSVLVIQLMACCFF